MINKEYWTSHPRDLPPKTNFPPDSKIDYSNRKHCKLLEFTTNNRRRSPKADNAERHVYSMRKASPGRRIKYKCSLYFHKEACDFTALRDDSRRSQVKFKPTRKYVLTAVTIIENPFKRGTGGHKTPWCICWQTSFERKIEQQEITTPKENRARNSLGCCKLQL